MLQSVDSERSRFWMLPLYLPRPANTATRGHARLDNFVVTYPACNDSVETQTEVNTAFPRRETVLKKLLRMKLFARFYVFTYEARAKLYVVKKDHDHKFHKATSSARRPSESYTGANRGTPPAPRFRRSVAAGSSAPGLF